MSSRTQQMQGKHKPSSSDPKLITIYYFIQSIAVIISTLGKLRKYFSLLEVMTEKYLEN